MTLKVIFTIINFKYFNIVGSSALKKNNYQFKC